MVLRTSHCTHTTSEGETLGVARPVKNCEVKEAPERPKYTITMRNYAVCLEANAPIRAPVWTHVIEVVCQRAQLEGKCNAWMRVSSANLCAPTRAYPYFTG